jgi:glycosyltransferase involved in cell wall biosynthesis
MTVSQTHTVIMVAACPYPSGQGTQAIIGEMARGLSLRGHRVHLLCYGHGSHRISEPFAIHRIRAWPGYKRLRSGPDAIKPALDALLTLRLIQILRRYPHSLVHAHNYEGALVAWLATRACGHKLIYHAHNLMEEELPGYFASAASQFVARKLGLLLDKSLPAGADQVLALHQPLANQLINRGVDKRRIQVIEPGIDVDFWRFQGEQKKNNQVVYCGNLDHYQNLDLLMHAFRKVVARQKNARLVLAINNPKQEGKKLIAKHGAFAYCRIVKSPDKRSTRRILHQSLLAVCPRTQASGFPIKNLNGAACGLALVTCRSAAHGVVDGQTGWVVPDNDQEALAEAIVSLLQNRKQANRMGQAGRQWVKKNHSLDKMTQSIESLYHALANEKSQGKSACIVKT